MGVKRTITRAISLSLKINTETLERLREVKEFIIKRPRVVVRTAETVSSTSSVNSVNSVGSTGLIGLAEYRRSYEATTSQDRKIQTERIISLKQLQ